MARLQANRLAAAATTDAELLVQVRGAAGAPAGTRVCARIASSARFAV